MDQSHINNKELKDFVESHSLQNRFSVIQFSANIIIETAQSELEEQMNVSITFDGYDNPGRLSLLESHLDPYEFPTVFEGKYKTPTFKHKEGVFLLIEGFHSQNPRIGNYTVKITPIERLRD